MSTIKTDRLEASTGTNTDLVVTGKGTGVFDIEDAAFKINGVAPTAGQIVTDTGWADPAAGGAWTVKSNGSLSAASTLTVTGITKNTRIIMFGMVNTSNGDEILSQLSTDGGAPWITAGYRFIHSDTTDAGSESHTGSTSNSAIRISAGVGVSGSAETWNVDVILYDPTNAAIHHQISGSIAYHNGTGISHGEFAGMNPTAHDIDAWKIFPQSGTFSGNYVVLELN